MAKKKIRLLGNKGTSLMETITPEILAPYLRIEADRSIKSADEFTQEVLDHYILGDEVFGVRMPWGVLDEKFRLRNGECTILAGINSSGKSLLSGQILLNAMEQGEKCLSVSLEMSPRSQLIRMSRQANLSVKPTVEFMLEFAKWSQDKLYFFDKRGSVDLNTLMAVIRYSLDHYGTRFILVDSLMTIAGVASDDYNAQKQVAAAIAETARDLECHILLVAHARKSISIKDRIDRFSIRGAGELADIVDNVLLLQRYYSDSPDDADACLDVSKARHWDMAECSIDLFLDPPSLLLYTPTSPPRETEMKNGQSLESI